jgi:hypothetical protein
VSGAASLGIGGEDVTDSHAADRLRAKLEELETLAAAMRRRLRRHAEECSVCEGHGEYPHSVREGDSIVSRVMPCNECEADRRLSAGEGDESHE